MVAVARNAYYWLKLVCHLCPFGGEKDLAVVIHDVVTSGLNYCSMLYVGLLLKMVERLLMVQNVAACILTRSGTIDYLTPIC